jgi:hypothetical protein
LAHYQQQKAWLQTMQQSRYSQHWEEDRYESFQRVG